VDANGAPFEWRGITAFRLVEMIASGNEKAATDYLDWARSERFNVVRVLLMAKHLFQLAPEAGRKALPRLLDLAKARGLTVEVVALADTKDVALDYEAHIREVGRIAKEKGNAFVEVANEPGHQTQDPRIHDAAAVKRLADLVPQEVIVALGSIEYGDGYALGDYATSHFPRGEDWDHVLALRDGAARLAQLKKPLVSDEPIGAGPAYDEGRRDDEPSRFAAAAALTVLTGMGATFHYEGGLQARIPRGREADCLAAWQTGIALFNEIRPDGEFIEGDRAARVVAAPRARAIFGRVGVRRTVVLLVDPERGAPVSTGPGWKQIRSDGVPGVRIVVAEHHPGRVAQVEAGQDLSAILP
jgi:hypothetical protein